MNDLTDDFILNGHNMSEYLINKIKNKPSFDMADVEALKSLQIDDIEA